MATIIKDIDLAAPADRVWAMLRDPGAAAAAFPNVLTASHLEGGVRSVTFANGVVVRERIVTIDDDRRRIAYGVIEGRLTLYNASLQVTPTGERACRVRWISDFLPDDAASVVAPLVEQGAAALAAAVADRS